VILSVGLPVEQLEREESVELHLDNAPGIFIMARAFHRLKLLLRLCPAELAGLGYVRPHPKGFLIQDVFVLPQRVTDSDAELDPEALLGFLAQFVADGGDPSSIQLWWHSHGDGEVYWSETDLETIERFPGNRVISVVGNQKGELLCRFDLLAPRRERLENLPLVLVDETGGEAALDLKTLRLEIREEIRTKVKRRLPMEPLTDHEGVVGFISYEGYEVEVEPSEEGSAPAPSEKQTGTN
jgi:proteasome lid subunit RPN8/RPN11